MNFRYHFFHATTLLVAAFCLTACLPGDLIGALDDDPKEEEPTNPGNPTDKDTVTVTPDGALVTHDDISINLPRGTFDQDVRVTISEASASDVTASPARSRFYKVSLPAVGTKKDITMTLKCNGTPGDAMMIVQQQGWNRHTGETQDYLIDIPSKVKGDARVATIDNFEATDGEQITFTVGLIDDVAPTRSETRTYTTRAGAKYAFTVTYDLGFNALSKEWWQSFLGTYYARKDDMLKAVRDYLPTVFETLNDNGYDMIPVTDTLKYYITTFYDDTWGGYVNSKFKTSWGVVELNVDRVLRYLDNSALKATLMHETLHAIYDRVYDNRYAWTKYQEGKNGDPWTLLDEAIGSWSEKLSEQEVINGEVTPKYAREFMKTFVPVERSYLNCRNHGYGMALFIEYLSQKTSNKDITKLYEYRRRAGQKSYDMYEALQKFFDEKGLKFATTKDYMDFALEALSGKLSNTFSIHDELLGKEKMPVEDFHVTNDNAVFGMGADILHYGFDRNDPANKAILENCDMTVGQNVEGLVTYVYGLKPKSQGKWKGYEMTLLGSSTSIEPCRISGKVIRDEYKCDLAFITVKEVSNYLSVTSTMKQEGVKQDLFVTFNSVSAEPDNINFPAEGGSKKVKVNYGTYRRYGYRINDADRSWISAEITPDVTVTFTAQPNTTGSTRETTVYCFVTNVENSTDEQRVYMPVKVTQEANEQSETYVPVKVSLYADMKCNMTDVYSDGTSHTSKSGLSWSQFYDCYEVIMSGTGTQYEFIGMMKDESGVHFNCYVTYPKGEVTHSNLTFDLDDLDKMADGTAKITNIKCDHTWSIGNEYHTKFSSNATLSMESPLHKGGPNDFWRLKGATWSMKGEALQFNSLEHKQYVNGKLSSYYSSLIPDEENKVEIFISFLDYTESAAPRRRVPLRATPGCASEEAPTAP